MSSAAASSPWLVDFMIFSVPIEPSFCTSTCAFTKYTPVCAETPRGTTATAIAPSASAASGRRVLSTMVPREREVPETFRGRGTNAERGPSVPGAGMLQGPRTALHGTCDRARLAMLGSTPAPQTAGRRPSSATGQIGPQHRGAFQIHVLYPVLREIAIDVDQDPDAAFQPPGYPDFGEVQQ